MSNGFMIFLNVWELLILGILIHAFIKTKPEAYLNGHMFCLLSFNVFFAWHIFNLIELIG